MAIPSRRAILSSSALHGAVLVAFAVFGASAAGRRPHAEVQIQEAMATPPPAAPAAEPVEITREPVADQQPVVEVEVVEPVDTSTAEPLSPAAMTFAPPPSKPNLERVVRKEPAAVEPPTPEQVPEPPVAVAPPAQPAPAESSPEQSERVAATPQPDNKPPAYPPEARRRGQEGEVVLAVFVDERGVVRSIVVDVTSGSYLLDRAAMRAVSRWSFEPARVDGVAIATETRVAVEFRIDG